MITEHAIRNMEKMHRNETCILKIDFKDQVLVKRKIEKNIFTLDLLHR